MQERTLDNLVLNGEDYIFAGNLRINGKVDITDGSLIVSGKLSIGDNVSVIGGDIVCGKLIIEGQNTFIRDGDIIVYGDFDAFSIDSDGNIEVSGNTNLYEVKCFNFLISGNNDTLQISATQDIYILGSNNSSCLEARDILITKFSTTTYHSVKCKTFYCPEVISNCCMTIG